MTINLAESEMNKPDFKDRARVAIASSITVHLAERVYKMSRQMNLSMAGLFRQALEDFCDKHEKS